MSSSVSKSQSPSRIGSNSERSSSLLSSLGPSIVHPGKGARKLKQIDNPLESIKTIVKSNQILTDALANLEKDRDILYDKIQNLEGEMLRNQDLIISLRGRILNLAESAAITGMNTQAKTTQRMETEEEEEEVSLSGRLTSNNAVQYLKENPLILRCVSENCGFEKIEKIIENNEDDTIDMVYGYSNHQLQRFAQAYASYLELSVQVETPQFVNSMHGNLIKVFGISTINEFIYDTKSTEYICISGQTNIQVPLLKGKSVLGTILKSGSAQIITDPQSLPSYNNKIDGIFNSSNVPELLVPSKTEFMIMVRNTKFTQEDLVLGQFFAKIIHPLVSHHIKYISFIKEVEIRRALHAYEAELSSINTFEALLPFLLQTLNEFNGANDINLYVIDGEFLCVLEVEGDKMVEKRYPRKGLVNWVIENKKIISCEHLNEEEVPSYDPDVDNWSFDKSLIACPILKGEEVCAVLCLSDKSMYNKFNDWDFEMLSLVCSSLALVIPRCIENSSSLNEDESIVALMKFPTTIKSLSFQSLEKEDFVENVAKILINIIGAEWLAIYRKANSEYDKLIVLHNDQIFDSPFLDINFVKYVFSEHKSINVALASQVENFRTINEVNANALICALNSTHPAEKILIIGLNSKTESGKFDENYLKIMNALSTYIVYSRNIQLKNKQICDATAATMTMTNAFNVCSTTLENNSSFDSLIEIVADLLSLQTFALLEFSTLLQNYQITVTSSGVKKAIISKNDVLIQHILDQKTQLPLLYSDFEKSDQSKSVIVESLPAFVQMLVQSIAPDRKVFLIFCGQAAASNYELLLYYFTPIVKVFYQCFSLSQDVKVDHREELNQIDFYHSQFKSFHFLNYGFDITSLSEPAKIEFILKMLTQMKFLEFFNLTLPELTDFVMKIRSSYNDLPYHNWSHAVDVAQFAYMILYSGNIVDIFKPYQVNAIILAALLNDAGHDGFTSSFHVKISSPLIYVFGEASPQEHNHMSIAVPLVQYDLVKDNKEYTENQSFWYFLTQLILSTDMQSHPMYMDRFARINSEINKANEGNMLLLAQLIIKISDCAHCIRQFENYKSQSENLFKEIQNENNILREMDKKIDTNRLLSMHESEIAFLDEVVSPMLAILAKIGDVSVLQNQVKSNKEKWQEEMQSKTESPQVSSPNNT